VDHLIVCGHLECRLVKAVLAPPENRPLSQLEVRLAAELGPVVRRYADLPAEALLAVLAQEQVLLQLQALTDSQLVSDRLADRRLKLYGWLIDDRTAKVFAYQVANGQFEELRGDSSRRHFDPTSRA
jgi:carbonic anhydrase